MRDHEVQHYLDEITRVLRPAGVALITCFLLDSEVDQLMQNGRSSRVFVEPWGEGFVEDPDHPESSVAYRDKGFRRWIEKAGMAIRGFHPGYWSGRSPSLSYQDILIVERPAG